MQILIPRPRTALTATWHMRLHTAGDHISFPRKQSQSNWREMEAFSELLCMRSTGPLGNDYTDLSNGPLSQATPPSEDHSLDTPQLSSAQITTKNSPHIKDHMLQTRHCLQTAKSARLIHTHLSRSHASAIHRRRRSKSLHHSRGPRNHSPGPRPASASSSPTARPHSPSLSCCGRRLEQLPGRDTDKDQPTR